MNIYQKLLVIQKEVMGLGKNGKTFQYEYVKGSKVIEAIKPLMNQHGLILKQEVVSIENSRQDYTTKNGSKSEILSKVMMRFTWIDSETGEKDENLFGANGQNDWEKGLGSALTYAERYFLLKYFHVNTDEDDIDNDQRKTTAPVLIPQPKIEPLPIKTKLVLVQNTKQWDDVVNAMTKGIEGRVFTLLDIEKKYTIPEKDKEILLEKVSEIDFQISQ